MPTQEVDREAQGVGAAAKEVAEHASAIVRLELELAAMELKRKITALGLGIGLALGAAVFLLFMVGFAYAAAAAALALVVPTWAALLIVTGILLLKVAILGILALGRIKKGTPPVPEQAIQEAKLTTEALKSDGHTA
jgi:protein-S-isoprenylcysteine O-methyltransferase Ste14